MTTKLILTQEQAEAVYVAGTALHRAGGMVDCILEVSGQHEQNICVWQSLRGIVKIAQGTRRESYDNWTAFADAYAAHYGLTIVEPESTIDRMVREAQERLAKQLDRDVAVHSAEITVAHWTSMFGLEPLCAKASFKMPEKASPHGKLKLAFAEAYAVHYGLTLVEPESHQVKPERHPVDFYGFTLLPEPRVLPSAA